MCKKICVLYIDTSRLYWENCGLVSDLLYAFHAHPLDLPVFHHAFHFLICFVYMKFLTLPFLLFIFLSLIHQFSKSSSNAVYFLFSCSLLIWSLFHILQVFCFILLLLIAFLSPWHGRHWSPGESKTSTHLSNIFKFSLTSEVLLASISFHLTPV